jgi:phospholipase C
LKRVLFVLLAAGSLTGLLLTVAELPTARHDASASVGRSLPDGTPSGIHEIRHIVIIMQENRSFDSYFGTYPGAEGIPGLAGHPGRVPCVPDPERHDCQRPYHDSSNRNSGGPHGHDSALADINSGKMNGFIAQVEQRHIRYCTIHANAPRCSHLPKRPDVMGYHDRREIPNYWRTRATSSSRITCSNPMRPGACPNTSTSSPAGRRTARERAIR